MPLNAKELIQRIKKAAEEDNFEKAGYYFCKLYSLYKKEAKRK